MDVRAFGVRAAALALGAALCVSPAPEAAEYLSHQDIRNTEAPKPDFVLRYGKDPNQFGHLRLPEGPGPFPVLVIIHGGCWLSSVDLEYMGRFAADFTQAGVATWSLEYRRVDSPGGGWPNTFLDVGKGIDHLRTLASEHRLDLSQVVVVGHSAGGHLALWAAGRAKIPEESPLHSATPLPIRGTVSLAGPGQLAVLRDTDNEVCGRDVVDELMGGSPEEVPGNYDAGSPIRLLPIGVRQRLLTGVADEAVPARFADAYAAAASKAGDDAASIALEGAAHFEIVVAGTAVWPEVRSIILGMFEKVKEQERSDRDTE